MKAIAIAEENEMYIVVLGTHSDTQPRLEPAIRWRWPDAAFYYTLDIRNLVDVAGGRNVDLVVVQCVNTRVAADAVNEIRNVSNEVPLLIEELPREESSVDVAKLLQSGADDVVEATTDAVELLARVVALLRRAWSLSPGDSERMLAIGALVLDATRSEASIQDQVLQLTRTEFNLLRFLASHRDRFVTRRAIGNALWGQSGDATALVVKYIQRVRQKMRQFPSPVGPKIVNFRGQGYRLMMPPDGTQGDDE